MTPTGIRSSTRRTHAVIRKLKLDAAGRFVRRGVVAGRHAAGGDRHWDGDGRALRHRDVAAVGAGRWSRCGAVRPIERRPPVRSTQRSPETAAAQHGPRRRVLAGFPRARRGNRRRLGLDVGRSDRRSPSGPACSSPGPSSTWHSTPFRSALAVGLRGQRGCGRRVSLRPGRARRRSSPSTWTTATAARGRRLQPGRRGCSRPVAGRATSASGTRRPGRRSARGSSPSAGWVLDLSWKPSGTMLVSSGTDGTVRLIDVGHANRRERSARR